MNFLLSICLPERKKSFNRIGTDPLGRSLFIKTKMDWHGLTQGNGSITCDTMLWVFPEFSEYLGADSRFMGEGESFFTSVS